MVDISINQLGGLCTLCFLELIDRYISKQHLFKRSIILVKAWCYYESRTLGAHHGLISTYALETLVMCIFHLFHSSLNGPLAVLHKFMDYFSTFDWDNYGITMYDPVPLSSPQGLIAEENESGLFNQDDIKNAVELFSAPLKAYENNSQKLTWKYLNIVDPLKEHNNIGRSVSQGNLYRIRSAFTYGMGMLNQILLLPKDEIAKELSMFFANIIEISSEGGRPGCEINGVSPASLQIDALDQETSPSSSSSNSKFEIDHAWKINPTPQPSCTKLIEDICYRINIMEVSDRKLPSCSSYQAATELFGFSKEALLPAKQILGVTNSRLYGSRINDEDDRILDNAEDKAERSEVSLIHWSFLGGDYDLHHRSLLFAICSLQSCGAIISSSMHQWHKMYMHLNATSFGPGLPFYPPGYYQVVSPYLSWRLEDTPRHRGTGTFIRPVQMSYSAYKERLAAWVPRSRHTRHGSQKNKLVRGGGNRKSFQPLRRPPQYYSLQQLEHFNQGWSYSFPSSFTAPIEWHPPVSVSCGEQAPELLYTPPPPQRPYQLKDDEEFPALPGRRQQQ